MALFAVLSAGIGGCELEKRVTIASLPAGAKVTLTRLYEGGAGSPSDVGSTPVPRVLKFGKPDQNISYRVRVTKERYSPAETVIRYEPKDQTRYTLDLKQDIVEVFDISYAPQATREGTRLTLQVRPARAYLQTIERSPNVRSVTRVTNVEDPMETMGPAVLAPKGETMLYPILVLEPKEVRDYTVVTGDTLDGVASRFGIEEWWLRRINGISPDADTPESGTVIKVASGRDDYSNIWRQSVGSAGRTRVTFGKSRDLGPAFSPDGTTLVFSSNRTSRNSTLWRVKLDGASGITRITSTLAEDYAPTFATDGTLLAYASIPPNADAAQIWTVDPNGALCTQLREGSSPQISPDGKWIVYVREDNVLDRQTGATVKRSNIWLMATDGSSETQLTQGRDADSIHPRWSPDGKQIVYATNEGLDTEGIRNFDIWMMSTDGGQRTQLTTNGSEDTDPCWNATGKTIYFRSNRGGQYNVWRFDPIMPN